jgi:hypothetical protein
VLYVWIALYSGYFFTRAQVAVQLAIVAGAYAATLLAVHPGQIGFTRWFITVGMVALAGSLVHVLKATQRPAPRAAVRGGAHRSADRTGQSSGL